jgi:hypothetical protein
MALQYFLKIYKRDKMNYTQTRWTILPEKPLLRVLAPKGTALLLSQLLINRAIINRIRQKIPFFFPQ